MTIKGAAFIAGAYEHPLRVIPDKSLTQVHAEVAAGALADAGLSFSDVDGLFTSSAAGFGNISLADYLGLKLTYMDTTQTGGSGPVAHVGHAAAAIAAGKCKVALVTLAGLPRQASANLVLGGPDASPEGAFESVYGTSIHGIYALAARRHMHEFGTTSEQLAEVRVAAALHASHNPNAMFQTPVTVEEVVNSPLISDPLHRLDCCVITDGGGAVVVVAPEVAASLDRHCIRVLGHGEAPKHIDNGHIDLTYSGARFSGPLAFAEAGVTQSDIDYVSIYDSFTITVVETLEDLGFCEKGKGGEFVMDGTLQAPFGKLPFNTDGGGLSNNHPANQGGMTKVIEAVRQLRGEANPGTQVPDCEIALAHGTGGFLGIRMGSVTLIMDRG